MVVENKYCFEIKNMPTGKGYSFFQDLNELHGGGYLGINMEEVKNGIIYQVNSYQKERAKITEPVKIKVGVDCLLFFQKENLIKLLQKEETGVEFCLG